MKNFFLGLSVGLTAGAVGMWFYAKKYWSKIYDKRIDDAVLGCKAEQELNNKPEEVVENVVKITSEDLMNNAQDAYNETENKLQDLEFIDETEFGNKNYEETYLLLYADKVLCYDNEGNAVVDKEITDWHLPQGWMDKAFEAEDGLIFCRDNIHREDYQIVRTDWNYNEKQTLVDSIPHRDRSVNLGNVVFDEDDD